MVELANAIEADPSRGSETRLYDCSHFTMTEQATTNRQRGT